MKQSINLNNDEDVGEPVGDSNEGMKEARDRYDAQQKRIMDRTMENSRDLQNQISSGSDFTFRPQDEGYRPYMSPQDRAIAEGKKDEGKYIESAARYGNPKSKAPQAPKVAAKPIVDFGREGRRASMPVPVDETKLSVSDRAKATRERARAGSGPTDKRSVTQRLRDKFGFASGGKVSSASKRADGIAQRGKTKGKMC